MAETFDAFVGSDNRLAKPERNVPEPVWETEKKSWSASDVKGIT